MDEQRGAPAYEPGADAGDGRVDGVSHREAPSYEPTGVEAVDRVLADVAAMVGSPLSEHVRVFEQAHEQLRRALDAEPVASHQSGDEQGS
ncbi:hypothetical protein GCM10009641_27610 [Mycobacterium cookii]|uniref:Uncharacterized protein n=1 Tax=Nocardioides furvisabuli TaxID=375542 RepID=A0ABN2WMB3_9ACTN|nr:hypothetical protein [Nocardioides furvisabuli]